MDENVQHLLECELDNCARCEEIMTIYDQCGFCEDWCKISEMTIGQDDQYVRWGLAPFDIYVCADCQKMHRKMKELGA